MDGPSAPEGRVEIRGAVMEASPALGSPGG